MRKERGQPAHTYQGSIPGPKRNQALRHKDVSGGPIVLDKLETLISKKKTRVQFLISRLKTPSRWEQLIGVVNLKLLLYLIKFKNRL